ncbi:MAG: chloride channel protein [Gammaproteobacteria bacterium]|nr:chloride channel protein [Gammaproteobacteria bacterium]NIR82572.1 chloride channel protein [Gammaproteobacteria bacterium]NIR88775.1 chloride channel protein [Gammaproteobacteria bacterium]NIV73980.1 CBS domain-containing protein [Gammaproteobacteria bacterium]
MTPAARLLGILSAIGSTSLLGLTTGIGAAVVAIAFTRGMFWVNDVLLLSLEARAGVADPRLLYAATIGAPTLGGLLVGLMVSRLPDQQAEGPADAIQAVHERRGWMDWRSGFLTGAASFTALGTGASVGLYGPLSHVGAVLGSALSRLGLFGRRLGGVGVGCGVAAAISTVFAAPIAGLIFAHEVVLRHYSLRAFAPVTLASVIAFVTAEVLVEEEPLLPIPDAPPIHAPEFLLFALTGVAGALLAIAFMRGMLLVKAASAGVRAPLAVKTMTAGAAVGLIALWVPQVLGVGLETLRLTVTEAFTAAHAGNILAGKLLATVLCLGVGFAGGVFTPSLIIGALLGALIGTGVEGFMGSYYSGAQVYAICGMGAVASAVIGAPLTTIVIVLELTRNYELAIAVMVSVVFSNLVSYRVFGRSFFDAQLIERSFDLSLGREKPVLQRRTIAPYVTREFVALPPGVTLREARRRLTRSRRNAAHVLDEAGRYLGTITLGRLAGAGADATPVIRLATPEAVVLSEDTSVWEAMQRLEDFLGESVPVVEGGGSERLIGVVFEASVLRAYMDVVAEIRREEHAVD